MATYSASDKTIALAALRFLPFAVFVAWLAVACYALAYLIAR